VNIAESFKVAIEGIAANKVRAGLTMLGVVIGVGAVIAMLAIGQGARAQTMSAIQSMGTNVLAVMAGQMRRGPVMGGLGSTQNLKMEDLEAILKGCSAVAKAAPELRSGAQVKAGNKNTSTTILGTSPDYFEIRNYRIARGKLFTDADVRSMRRVAIIGPTVTYNLFGSSSPINKTIRIRGISFRVIGETAAKGAGGFQDPDDQIFIPITTAQTRVFGVDYLRSISVQVKSAVQMSEAVSQIETLLRKRHRLGAASENDFMIFNQADLMETAEQASNTFTMLLAGIAAVSLIVGGIGIMNIMLVSVTERTREIGIRKAVGARRRDILMQFLIESVVLSLAGGIIGILFGVIGAQIIARSAGWPVTVSVSSIVLAFVFAAAVGIFFGIYPARRASFLNPIDALRYE